MHVFRPTPEDPLSRAFLAAGIEAGHPTTQDISGYQPEGFGVFGMLISTYLTFFAYQSKYPGVCRSHDFEWGAVEYSPWLS